MLVIWFLITGSHRVIFPLPQAGRDRASAADKRLMPISDCPRNRARAVPVTAR